MDDTVSAQAVEEYGQAHVLRIELDIVHDEEIDHLLDIATGAAKAALEARGAEVWGSGGAIVAQPTWLYRTARDLGGSVTLRTGAVGVACRGTDRSREAQSALHVR